MFVGIGGVIALSIAHIAVVAIGQFAIICMFSVLYIIANGRMHDMLPSHLRAGASSTVSTITTLCFLPLLGLFGIIAQHFSVFQASFMLLPIAVVGAVSFWRIYPMEADSNII